MKRDELLKAAKCGVCGHKIGKTGLPMFWRITVERHGLKKAAIDRHEGLAQMLGGSQMLASPSESIRMWMVSAFIALISLTHS